MLVVECQEHLNNVMEFARECGLDQQFRAQLDYLDNYAGYNNTKCRLYRDFAPYSFEFVMFKDGEKWFNGGLIYQGPNQRGDGSFPALTVSLDSSDGWHIHT